MNTLLEEMARAIRDASAINDDGCAKLARACAAVLARRLEAAIDAGMIATDALLAELEAASK